jgi:hypothetical protein
MAFRFLHDECIDSSVADGMQRRFRFVQTVSRFFTFHRMNFPWVLAF